MSTRQGLVGGAWTAFKWERIAPFLILASRKYEINGQNNPNAPSSKSKYQIKGQNNLSAPSSRSEVSNKGTE